MSSPAKLNLTIYQGSTFSEVLRWESPTKVYKNITGITQAAPAVVTSTSHGIPDSWRVKITNVVGMKEINSSDTYRKATLLSANTIELNEINAAGYTAYSSGGIIEYNLPVDLTGYTARMQIRAKLEDTTVLLELTTENGRISINNTTKTISLTISATDTAAITWLTGVYSLELVNGGVVSTLIAGNVSVKKEVTR
jgi:hypothetical protein